jgi:hypothetical protein
VNNSYHNYSTIWQVIRGFLFIIVILHFFEFLIIHRSTNRHSPLINNLKLLIRFFVNPRVDRSLLNNSIMPAETISMPDTVLNVFFPWRWGGSSTQAWMPTYVSILRIPQMIWVWRATAEWYIDRVKLKNSEKNLTQCHFVHCKSHMDWPGREHGPLRWEAGD